MQTSRKLFTAFLLLSLITAGFAPYAAKVASAASAPPTIISYQGRLADSGGNLLGGAGTTYYFKFSIWDSATVGAGNKIWPVGTPATTTATVRQGVFNVNVGDTANGYPDPLNINFANYSGLYLQVEVSADNNSSETLSPRQQLTSSIYAQVSGAVVGSTTQSAFGTTTPALNAFVTIAATSSNTTGLTIVGAPSQTANLFQIQNNSFANLFNVSSAGAVSIIGSTTIGGVLNAVNGGFLNITSATTSALTVTGSSTISGAFNSLSSNLFASSTLFGSTLLTNATTSTFAITGIATGNLLKTTTGGAIIAAVAGSDYITGSGLASSYPFPASATSSIVAFNGGLTTTGATSTGTLAVTGSTTLASLLNVNGSLNANGGGAFAGTFSGAHTYSGTVTFSSGLVSNGSTTISSVSSGLVGASNGLLYGFASSSLFGYTPLNPTRQLTIAGTASQITSSAGAQDLSADRTWTLSLPNHVIFPTDFVASAGSTTNATSSTFALTNVTSCSVTNALTTTSSGSVICGAISGGAGTSPFVWSSNYGVVTAATSTNPIWAQLGLFASSTSHLAAVDFVIATGTNLTTTGSTTVNGALNVGSNTFIGGGLGVGNVNSTAGSLTTSAAVTVGSTEQINGGTGSTYLTFAGAGSLTNGTFISFGATNAGGGLSAFTGSYISGSNQRNAGINLTDTGQWINFNRQYTPTAGITTVNGDLVDLASSCNGASAACIDNSHILSITQSATSSSASALFVTTSGIGPAATFTGGGILAVGSTTIGNGTAGGGLTISGAATTTGTLAVTGSTTLASLLNVNGSLNANGGGTFSGTFAGAHTYSGLITDSGGFISTASSTIGNGTQVGGLTISGGATTTGIAYFGSNVGIGTTSPFAKLSINANYGDTASILFAIGSTTNSGTTNIFTVSNGGNAVFGTNFGSTTGQLSVMHGTTTASRLSQASLSSGGEGMYVQGRYAYVVENGSSNSFEIYDISNPASPVRVSQNNLTGNGRGIYVQGRYAYIVDTTTKLLEIWDVSNPVAPQRVSQSAINASGLTIYVQGHYAYLVDNGSTNAFEIWDVANPAAPVRLSQNSLGFGSSIMVQGDYAYIVDSNISNSLEIWNVSNPAAPVQVSQSSLTNNGNTVFVQGRYAYIADSGTTNAFEIWDISNPATPVRASLSSLTQTGAGIYVQGRYAYLTDQNTTNAFEIWDVSNPFAPVRVAQNTLNANGWRAVVQGRYAYIADSGTTNALETWDLGGSYVDQLEAGGIEAGSLSVRNNLFAMDGAFGGGLTVGNNANISGSLAITGSTFFATTTASQNNTLFSIGSASTTVASLFNVNYNGTVGIGTSTPAGGTPFSKFAIHANNGDTATTLFAIGSSTASATTTLFSVDNTGTASTTKLFGALLTSCNSGSNALTWNAGTFGCNTIASAAFSYPFPAGATSSPLMLLASTTIGNGTQVGGLTISGGATTTGNAYIGGVFSINDPTLSYRLETTGSSGNGYFGVSSSWGLNVNEGDIFAIAQSGNVGIGTSTPYARFAILATSTTGINNPTTLFAIASTTGGTATSTLFTITNTGLVTLLNLIAMASSTIGNGTAAGGLTISGGATTTGNFIVQTQTNSTLAFQVQNSQGAPIFTVDTTTTNYLVNPGFEVNTTGWAVDGANTIARITNTKYHGIAALQVSTPATANTGVKNATFNTALVTGTQYTLSFYAQAATTTFSTLRAGRADDGSTESACTLNSTTVVTAGWTRYFCTFTTGTISGSPYIFIEQTDAVGRSFNIDAVQLQTGGSITPYTIGATQLRGIINAPVSFNSTSNSNTAFQIQDASSTANLFIADTLNNGIDIGTTTGLARLTIQGTSTNEILEIAKGATGASAFHITSAGNVGIGTSSPFATLSVAGGAFITGGATSSALAILGSTTISGVFTSLSSNLFASTTLLGNTLLSNATTSTFALTNVTSCSGSNALTTTSSGSVICGAITGGTGAAYPFLPVAGWGNPVNGTSTLIGFTGGLFAIGSTTIGNGTQVGGLTISGGATTTGVAYFASNVGIGTTSPFANLSLFTGGDFAGHAPSTLFAIGSSTAGRATSTLFVINSAGNIGIGTTSPFALLSIQTQTAGNAFTISNAIGSTTMQVSTVDTANNIFEVATSTGSAYFDITSSGSVGIGTTTPWARFAVDTSNLATGVAEFAVGSSTRTDFVIKQNGNLAQVLIGTTSVATTSPVLVVQGGTGTTQRPVASFYNGSGSCSISPTGGSISCVSDQRLKKDFNPLAASTSLQAILQLNPLDFNWNFEKDSDPQHSGFIAQQIQQIFPDIVTTDPLSGYLQLNYAGLTPYLASAIQAQQAELGLIASSTATTTQIFITNQNMFFGFASTTATSSPALAIWNATATTSASVVINGNFFVNGQNIGSSVASSSATTTAAAVLGGPFADASAGVAGALSDAFNALTGLAQSGVRELGLAVHASVGAFDKLFAKEVHTDKLCVGSTCVTEAQFLQMVQTASASSGAAQATAPSNPAPADPSAGQAPTDPASSTPPTDTPLVTP